MNTRTRFTISRSLLLTPLLFAGALGCAGSVEVEGDMPGLDSIASSAFLTHTVVDGEETDVIESIVFSTSGEVQDQLPALASTYHGVLDALVDDAFPCDTKHTRLTDAARAWEGIAAEGEWFGQLYFVENVPTEGGEDRIESVSPAEGGLFHATAGTQTREVNVLLFQFHANSFQILADYYTVENCEALAAGEEVPETAAFQEQYEASRVYWSKTGEGGTVALTGDAEALEVDIRDLALSADVDGDDPVATLVRAGFEAPAVTASTQLDVP